MSNAKMAMSLRLSAFPPTEPYERWELMVETTGEILASGSMPLDEHVVRAASDAYHARTIKES